MLTSFKYNYDSFINMLHKYHVCYIKKNLNFVAENMCSNIENLMPISMLKVHTCIFIRLFQC